MWETIGDIDTARTWKPVARALMMGKFSSIDSADTAIRLTQAEYLDIIEELLDELFDKLLG